jgi:hypothetical protein
MALGEIRLIGVNRTFEGRTIEVTSGADLILPTRNGAHNALSNTLNTINAPD